MGVFTKMLATMSGNSGVELSKQLLFDKVIGFKSMSQGAGASSVLFNFATYLAENTKYSICILDTNFLYPLQDTLFHTVPLKEETSILYGNLEVSTCVRATNYTNLYCVGLRDSTVLELLSGKDSVEVVNKVFDLITLYFDIILVDLSSELSNLSIHSAIRCNKIVNVFEDSIKCVNYLNKSVNVQRTLGVPWSKMRYCILNKMVGNTVKDILDKSEYELLGCIPLDVSIAETLVSGVAPLKAVKRTDAIDIFNKATVNTYTTLVPETNLTKEYTLSSSSIQEALKAKEKKEKAVDNTDLFVEDTSVTEEEEIDL